MTIEYHSLESKVMTDLPLISVVMPNYNGRKFVEQAINSVLRQTYINFELIVVDDCSTDDSLEIIKSISKEDNRIKIISLKQNLGVALARNRGISEAKGDYIALIDNDDLWIDDKLERQLAIAKKGADVVYCSYDFIDENNKIIKRAFIVPQNATFKSMLTSSVISCSTAFVKADLLKQHPFKADYYHEDYVLWMELLGTPINAVGDSKVLMHYRQIKGSRSNKKGNAARERWKIYRTALGLNLFHSIVAFVGYSINGAIKYYF